MSEFFEVDDTIASSIADKLIQGGLQSEISSPRVTLSFSIPQDSWEAECAINGVPLAVSLWSLYQKVYEYRHEEDKAENKFWQRFSKEIESELKENGLWDLVIQRMK